MDFGRVIAEYLNRKISNGIEVFFNDLFYLPLFIFHVRPLLGLPFGIAFKRSFSWIVDASVFILNEKRNSIYSLFSNNTSDYNNQYFTDMNLYEKDIYASLFICAGLSGVNTFPSRSNTFVTNDKRSFV
jgi:hypothetical protein